MYFLNMRTPAKSVKIKPGSILNLKLLVLSGCLSLSVISLAAQHQTVQSHVEQHIVDSWHYSKVFGEIRNFRVFFPPDYFISPSKRYPVIYFFHGWAQRYFGSVADYYSEYDQGIDNNGDNISNFVSKNEVIVVKLDGYDGSDYDEYTLSPYNIGSPETFRQFPPYFEEFVLFFDEHYRTLADRNHRAVSGLSMGGFMTFWISGKYPHLVCAAGNFCGSPEFIVGPTTFPVEYKHANMYDNYGGVNVQLHYGDKDNLRFYHRDLNKIWLEVMDNYHYKVYNARHTTCGLADMFEFILETFENPPVKPEKWDHIDIYPEFKVWDYQVSSNRFLSGFTILENVDKRGFKSSIRTFLPDGELMPFVELMMTTAPHYEPGQHYIINDITPYNKKIDTVRSDSLGRLKIQLDGGIHNIGINKLKDLPNLGIASVSISNLPWATTQKNVELAISLLNKGAITAEGIKVKLEAFKEREIDILKGSTHIDHLGANDIEECKTPLTFLVERDSVEIVKFKLTMSDRFGNKWTESFEVEMYPEIPYIENFVVADGGTYTVARAAVDSVTVKLGKGNGDGIINPGESIAILIKDHGKLWPAQLSTNDPYINPFGVNIRKSDSWSSYDHVGGSSKYSIPVIASHCPENHALEFLAEYWLPGENKNHIIKKVKINTLVQGNDITPPQVEWAHVTADNTLMVRIYDGAEIDAVRARMMPVPDVIKLDYMEVKVPKDTIEVDLNDAGIMGDKIAKDNVFSGKVPKQSANFFRLEVTAEDRLGNKSKQNLPKTFLIY